MITITNELENIDVGAVHAYLANESYWAKNIPRELVERSIANSLCFAALDDALDAGALVGFARVVTDYATFGYIADVFVVESHRGRGISKRIMQAIREHPELQRLRRWHVVTRDAQGLYTQYGFQSVAHPERHMEIMTGPYARPE